MRRLHKVIHVTNQKHLITRVSPNQIKDLKIGQAVVTKNLTRLGKILDIFGPVNQPFISVKVNPGIETPANLVGEVIYSLEEKTSQKRRRS